MGDRVIRVDNWAMLEKWLWCFGVERELVEESGGGQIWVKFKM